MILTFDGDIGDVWNEFFIYYEELGCYFIVRHGQMADYSVRFPAYKKDNRGFQEFLLNTDISIFTNRREEDYPEILQDAIEQIKDISQRNLLPQFSNVQENLLDLVFENNANLKVKE